MRLKNWIITGLCVSRTFTLCYSHLPPKREIRDGLGSIFVVPLNTNFECNLLPNTGWQRNKKIVFLTCSLGLVLGGREGGLFEYFTNFISLGRRSPTLPAIKCRSPWAPLHHKPPLEAQRVDKDAMMEWENYLMTGLFHLFTSTRI